MARPLFFFTSTISIEHEAKVWYLCWIWMYLVCNPSMMIMKLNPGLQTWCSPTNWRACNLHLESLFCNIHAKESNEIVYYTVATEIVKLNTLAAIFTGFRSANEAQMGLGTDIILLKLSQKCCTSHFTHTADVVEWTVMYLFVLRMGERNHINPSPGPAGDQHSGVWRQCHGGTQAQREKTCWWRGNSCVMDPMDLLAFMG